MPVIRHSILRNVRFTSQRGSLPLSSIRTYAATQGQGSPEHSSNVAQPTSDSAEEQSVKQSRATDSQSSPDTASLQTPVDNPTGASTGQQEGDTGAHETLKENADKPASEKRRAVEEQGQKPLDAADK
ncbi:hypothetical protein LTR50_001352 [Elasticomyces elasticus]|nr:hypothetical protein LTR50_001352 [Elasticomyces elasticus]